MRIRFHRRFQKQFAKLNARIREQATDRIALFQQHHDHPLLHDHALHGERIGYRSINISGDLRAIYRIIHDDVCIFVAIGTHSELYE